MILGLLAAIAVIQSGVPPVNKQEASDQTAKSIEAWTNALAEVAKTEATAIIFDVNIQIPSPTGYRLKLGKTGMKWLAAATNRSWKEVDGVQLFTRTLNADKVTYLSHVAEFSDFLNLLSGSDKSKLIGDGLPLSAIPSGGEGFLGKVIGPYSTVSASDVLATWQKSALRLKMLPRLEYVDPTTNQVRSVPLIGRETTERALKRSGTTSGKGLIFDALMTPPTGSLKIAPGKCMKLSELIAEAAKAFEVSLMYDKRLADSLVFVSGQFDRDIFLRLIGQVSDTKGATIGKMNRTSSDLAYAEVLKQLAGVRNQEMDDFGTLGATAGDFLDGREASLTDLVAGNDELKASLAMYGVPPGAKVKLTCSFGLQVETFGEQPYIELSAGGIRVRKSRAAWSGGVPLKIGP